MYPLFEDRDGKCFVAWCLNGSVRTMWIEFTPTALSEHIQLAVNPATKKRAREEASILGLESHDGHIRPNHAAPEGKTRSYHYDEWKPED